MPEIPPSSGKDCVNRPHERDSSSPPLLEKPGTNAGGRSSRRTADFQAGRRRDFFWRRPCGHEVGRNEQSVCCDLTSVSKARERDDRALCGRWIAAGMNSPNCVRTLRPYSIEAAWRREAFGVRGACSLPYPQLWIEFRSTPRVATNELPWVGRGKTFQPQRGCVRHATTGPQPRWG